MQKLIKSEEPHALTILDQESGEFVEVSHEKQRLASYAHNQVLMGAFISAISIKKIFDEKLYLGLNCGSRDEYCETMLPFGRRQAFRLYAIANKFDAVSKSLTGDGLTQITSGDTSDLVTLKSQTELAGIGVTKLYELTRLEDDDIKDLIKGGKLKTESGDYDIEDIKDASAKELSRIVSESTKKYKTKISQLTEEVALLSEEKKAKDKELERLAKEKEELEGLERIYGPMASQLKLKKKLLTEARDLLDTFNEVAIRIGVTEDDPENMRKGIQDLIRSIDDVHNRVLGVYETVILD